VAGKLNAMLFECVPNLSEGRDRGRIQALANAAGSNGAALLDVSSDRDHHRTVLSLAGSASALTGAVLNLYGVACSCIDLRRHHGAHPRIGAVDVVPFVPLAGATMADARALAEAVAEAVAERFALPVLLYGDAARDVSRRRLASFRRGGLRGLASRLERPNGGPDYGPARLHPTAGASAIGARPLLVAFNVVLDSDDLVLAKRIAARVRESGGGLPGVLALGFGLPERTRVQVSMNLLDPVRTPPRMVFDRVSAEAARAGVRVQDSEIVGLVPAAALAPGDADVLRLKPYGVLEQRLAAAGIA